MATMLLMTSEQAFCFRPCSTASAFVKAPFVIAFFAPAFMDFMGGNMLLGSQDVLWEQADVLLCCCA